MAPPAPHLVDELLEDIFLRLPTPAALARASTASPRFRRIITDRSFLRRFRKLHPPPLLGGSAPHGAAFAPAEAPHPSAPLARALADAADFTYSFVPKPSNDHSWRPCNVRDGRVLLESSRYGTFRELAVCDPLSQRYVLLPPIPEHMSVQEQRPWEFRSILAPIAEEDEDETSFKLEFFGRGTPMGAVWLSKTDWDVDYFSLDVKTSELAKFCISGLSLPMAANLLHIHISARHVVGVFMWGTFLKSFSESGMQI
uniref:Uncharacterized protein n=1 Tax=Aegilops tauschii TaxID=37682 RepID=M8BL51_AEGTA